MPRHFLLRSILSLALLGLFILDFRGDVRLPILRKMETLSYDWRIRLSLPNTVDPRIVILDIDERSLAEVGRWPWGRNTLAKLMDNLFDHYKAGVVGFDVVFAEKDESSGLKILEALEAGDLHYDRMFREKLDEIRPTMEWDRIFSESLKNRPVILGYYFKPPQPDGSPSPSTGALPPPAVRFEGEGSGPFIGAGGFGGNLDILQKNAFGGGFFDNPVVSRDGVFRRVPVLQVYKDGLYESLALAVLRAMLGGPGLQFDTIPMGEGRPPVLDAITVGGLRIPVDRTGSLLAPYRGRQGAFPYVSIVDVLEKRADPKILEGAVLLVGATAPGLMDLRSTPVQNVYPGVEVHANIISGILDGRVMNKAIWVDGAEFVWLVVLGVLVTLLFPFLSPLKTLLAVLLLGGANLWINLHFWYGAKLVLPLASPMALLAGLFLLHVSFGFFMESLGKKRISRVFGQYIPNELVDEMNRTGTSVEVGGESREMTVLFSDVRGFTTISEGLDPQELVKLMNAFLTPMTKVVHDQRGTIDKYMGDAIMAFWGAPLADPKHAEHGVRAALEMVKAMAALRTSFEKRGWKPIKVGIGLNTGTMNVGNMGSDFRLAYTVLGDAVNLGSRVEGLTKAYGVQIIITEATRAAIEDLVCRELDRVRVKGKAEPVTIYEPVGFSADVDDATRSEVERFDGVLAAYRGQDWDAAQAALEELKAQDPERALYPLYLERIAHFRKSPPPEGWDGVFTHTTK